MIQFAYSCAISQDRTFGVAHYSLGGNFHDRATWQLPDAILLPDAVAISSTAGFTAVLLSFVCLAVLTQWL